MRYAQRLCLPRTVVVLLLGLLVGVGSLALPQLAGRAAAAPPAQYGLPTAVARFDNVSIYSGPSVFYPVIGTIPYGQGCTVTGRDTVSGWWLVQCPNGVTGWVSFDSVNIIGDTSQVPLFTSGGVPAPTPAPQPPPSSAWRANYYANKDLAGAPVLIQDLPDINFDWGTGSPGPTVPPDYFSARYERTLSLAPGDYLLTLRMDDGARVFVDDQPVLDDWRNGAVREVSTVRTLSGNVRLRVEYFEETAQASIFFAVTPMNVTPPAPTPPPWPSPAPDLPVVQDQWRAQYYNNTDLGGSPTAALYEQRGFYPLDRNWGMGSPAVGIGPDYWSARFEGQFYFAQADYEFFAQSDDGVRMYIDNILLFDAWFDGYNFRSNRFNQVGEGWHTMRVEYFDRTGNASLRAWWSFAGSQQPIGGPVPPPPTPY